MDLYTHQQQSTQQIDTDSMAAGSSSATPNSNSSTTATVAVTHNSSNNSTNNNISSNSSSTANNNNNSRSSTPPTSTSAVATADAATVAIAKDMLQLHHGGPTISNNNDTNSNNSAAAAAASIVAAAETIETTTGNTAHVSSSSGGASASAISTANSPPPASVSNNTISTSTTGFGETPLGFLKYEDDLLYISGPCTVIGRNSSTSSVQFHVAENNLVSRKHFQLLYDAETRDFYVQCLSKNGIFVDDFLQRRNADPLKLQPSCYFRFPSTEIRIQFESFMQSTIEHITAESSAESPFALNNNHHHHHHHHHGLLHNSNNILSSNQPGNGNAHVIISPAPPDDQLLHAHASHHIQHPHSSSSSTASAGSQLLPMDTSNIIYSPLKISIPKKEQKSPYLSPTGTISAANSCPASPRQGLYQNQINYNNYGNNNLQNDHFQTPSTVNYNINEKPPYSYAQLIVQAISAAPDKQLTLSGIYSFIVKHYPYYRKETNKGWQNSIRHNLSLNRYFIKVARSQDEPGKGSFWRIDPESGAKLIDHSYKKRRQRSSQGFRSPYGMPRSAPVSPSHMDYTADNSRESSPLQDIVLQSAPGSPGMSMENRAGESDLMYNSQAMHQAAANNSHSQYNAGSPLYISNQNPVIGMSSGAIVQQQSHPEAGGGGGGSGVGALIALKRNHAMSSGVGMGHFAHQQQQQHQNQQPLHPDIIYEEMPTDYSGNVESGDECEATKRPKYLPEVL